MTGLREASLACLIDVDVDVDATLDMWHRVTSLCNLQIPALYGLIASIQLIRRFIGVSKRGSRDR
jgi:hypothetical protein